MIRRALARWMRLASVLLLLLASCGGGGSDNDKEPVEIGALLSLTGNWSTLGIASFAALDFAVADVNAALEREGTSLRFALDVRDTRLEPGLAREQLEDLAREGIRFVVGPQSSSEVAALREAAD